MVEMLVYKYVCCCSFQDYAVCRIRRSFLGYLLQFVIEKMDASSLTDSGATTYSIVGPLYHFIMARWTLGWRFGQSWIVWFWDYALLSSNDMQMFSCIKNCTSYSNCSWTLKSADVSTPFRRRAWFLNFLAGRRARLGLMGQHFFESPEKFTRILLLLYTVDWCLKLTWQQLSEFDCGTLYISIIIGILSLYSLALEVIFLI